MEKLSHRKKILLIDDEPELVKAIDIRLKSTGYEVSVAYDGRAGIHEAKEIKPDLILLDLIMPTMDGYSVAKILKDDPETKHIPIIILTASQREDLKTRCRELGVTSFIMKPFDTSDLLNMVNKILRP
jgi:two-component system alkaline phosphatase synthesis response regulator PhoP